MGSNSISLCVQIEQQVMYTALKFSLDSLAVTTCAGPAGHLGQQEGSHMLFPLSMTGSVSLCKLPCKRLPQAKAWLSVESIEVTAAPQHLQLLTSLSKHGLQQRSTQPDAVQTAPSPSQVSAKAVQVAWLH